MIIGELARRTGVSTWSLRHYDRAGLLTSTRGSNRYRDFPEQAVREVRRIRCLLAAGLNVREVSEVLPHITDSGRLEPSETVRKIIGDRIRDVQARIAGLERMRRVLCDAAASLRQAE